MKEIFNSLHFLSVKTVMAVWRNLRDPYRKKILNPDKPGGRGHGKSGGRGGGGGGKKSGSKGASLGEQQETWKFYERMSFYKPYIYMNKYANPFHDTLNPCHNTRNPFHNKRQISCQHQFIYNPVYVSQDILI